MLYPEDFPLAAGPQRPGAGWLARAVADERVELRGSEPRYLRRPDAVTPGRPQARVMTIRPATSDDVADIAASELTNLGSDAWTAGLVEQGVAGALPTVRYLVAEVDGEVVGHAVASLVADVGELQRIAVDPEHRRRGFASALLAGVLAEAARSASTACSSRSARTTRAPSSFYEKHGFVELDRRPGYYRDGATAIVMQRVIGMGP